MAGTPEYDIELTHAFDAAPERIFRAFTEPDQFARWYGPTGFPTRRDSVELDPRIGGTQRFVMEAEADPSMRTAFDGHFTDVVPNQLLASSGHWEGIPGQTDPWPSHLRVEFHEEDGRTRLVLREGPHPAGTADLGYQAWETMFAKLDALLGA
ncbi:MAG: SRPBCC family protein [Nocardioidaceae bacterium]